MNTLTAYKYLDTEDGGDILYSVFLEDKFLGYYFKFELIHDSVVFRDDRRINKKGR